MSYILEALKKAQAERQLGDLPTIHAPAISAAPAARAGLRNKALPLALGALGLATAGLLALVLRPAPPAAPGVAPAPTGTPSAVAAVAAVAPVAMPAPLPVAQLPAAAAPTTQAQPVAMPATAAEPVATPPQTVAARSAPAPAVAVAAPDVAAKPVRSVPMAAAATPPAPEETLQNLRDLPEPIQRAIPPITVGGYIYSHNPADRLLLIDKVLRHEGEEVAPGLVLDKLQPKAAVFTFKGYRYRVPY